MTYSWKPARALEDEPYEVQAATLREQLRYSESRTRYWIRRYEEQNAQLSAHKQRDQEANQ